jgi:hypothetical protein
MVWAAEAALLVTTAGTISPGIRGAGAAPRGRRISALTDRVGSNLTAAPQCKLSTSVLHRPRLTMRYRWRRARGEAAGEAGWRRDDFPRSAAKPDNDRCGRLARRSRPGSLPSSTWRDPPVRCVPCRPRRNRAKTPLALPSLRSRRRSTGRVMATALDSGRFGRISGVTHAPSERSRLPFNPARGSQPRASRVSRPSAGNAQTNGNRRGRTPDIRHGTQPPWQHPPPPAPSRRPPLKTISWARISPPCSMKH